MPLLQGLRPYVSPDLTLKSSRLFTLWYSNVAVKSHEISMVNYNDLTATEPWNHG